VWQVIGRHAFNSGSRLQKKGGTVLLKFENEMIEWRGPAPFHYVPVPQDLSDKIKQTAKLVSYGWGVIPVKVIIGRTAFNTSLFPKDGIYLVPIKNAVRLPEKLALGQSIAVTLEVNL
jgi:hypothetical protein